LEVEALFRRVGKVSISTDILSGKWMKVVVNSVFLGLLGALGLPIQAAAAMPGARELMLRIGADALEIGQCAGYSIQPIFGLKPEEIAGSNRLLELIFDKLIADVGPQARPAVLQDHLKGRYSEVDAINGLIVRKERGSDGLRPSMQPSSISPKESSPGRLCPIPSTWIAFAPCSTERHEGQRFNDAPAVLHQP
jgi:ketopantoate reductase